MDEIRKKYFRENLTQEEKYALTYRDFLVSEILEIIAETVLCDDDKKIATLKYTKAMTNSQIADVVDLDEKTIQHRIPAISEKIRHTIVKLLW